MKIEQTNDEELQKDRFGTVKRTSKRRRNRQKGIAKEEQSTGRTSEDRTDIRRAATEAVNRRNKRIANGHTEESPLGTVNRMNKRVRNGHTKKESQ